MSAPAPPSQMPASPVRRVFFGPERLRAGWRVLAFVALTFVLGAVLRAGLTAARVTMDEGWTPRAFVLAEAIALAIALLATAAMGRADRLPLARYGVALREAFGARFWEGTAWGFAIVALLVGAIAALGGYQVHGLAQHGGALLRTALGWLLAMVFVGLAEEVGFRGYLLAALADGIGFWPGAIASSLLFSALHYFGKPMENAADALSVGLIGLFFCFSIRRTGSLWFAIGFHFAFDFAALALFGAPNTGNQGRPIPTHLLDSAFHGPDWLTGGVRGVEASWLVFPVIALLFALLHVRFRATRFRTARER